MIRSSILFASLVLAAATAEAQSPNHLVGVTRIAGNVRHQDHPGCAAIGACAPAGFPSAVGLPGFAGGSAWDPIHSGVWISNGQFLACVDDACNYLCAPFAVPGMGGAVVIAGLEVVESRNELWLIDSAGVLRRMNLACPPAPVGLCAVVYLDPTLVTTGLAVDELNGFVFYSRVDLVTGANVVAWADLAAPCAILNGFVVPPCAQPFGPFTGLACDATTRTLYGTDGSRTISFNYLLAGGAIAAFAGAQCCPPVAGNPDPLIGLAVRPGGATSAGAPCSNGTCPGCPMNHGLRSDPVLGNAAFALRLGGAQNGTLAWCAIGLGPCALPGAVVPPLCGPVYATPLLGMLGLAVVGGGAGCGGSADFTMPLPPAAGLAGMVLSSQCIVLCAPPAGIGTQLSNCLSFELQGI